MSPAFLCTAMARSRSHWLANALDSDVSCHHDLSALVSSPEEYFERLGDSGVVDTAAHLVPGLVERFESVPWIILSRDRGDAVRSAVRAGFPKRVAEWGADRASAFGNRVRMECESVLSVDFSELSEDATGQRIFEHIGLAFDAGRWNRLQSMKIDHHGPFEIGSWLVEQARAAA